ncbi:DNA polymerase [Frankia sp. AiPa1]|nr:DNA polymerase [Frankia sp. AiPa1]MCL9762071.1 DNA polymerase [Frankia sp. AiPa1]
MVAVPAVGFALAWQDPAAAGSVGEVLVAAGDERAAGWVAEIERRVAPRWVWWSTRPSAGPLLAAGLHRVACWDLSAVHRLLHGGRRGDQGAVWAAFTGRPAPPPPVRPTRPVVAGQLDLWDAADADVDPTTGTPDASDPPARAPIRGVGAGAARIRDGERPAELVADQPLDDGWPQRAASPAEALRRAGELARRAVRVQEHQERELRRFDDPRPRPGPTPLAVLTARSESAAELLARELERDGLPLARPVAAALLTELIGPAPRSGADELAARRDRDAPVLTHLPRPVDLRNPAAVRMALRSVGIDVPDTRSGRLEPLRAAHPVVGALLAWRRAERIATTYGHRWLDDHVGPDGRLRGTWHGSDGGAGRMTAQAGLHNLPADLRVAVVAEPGRVFVRADLGQIEPRVLAVVSGDPALARATQADDMYAPVAAHLGRPRAEAKVAMLAAMYGQTTGSAGEALRRMRRAYPTALDFLDAADAAGRDGRDLRTFGGRLLRLTLAPTSTAPLASPPGSPGSGRGLTEPAWDEPTPPAPGATTAPDEPPAPPRSGELSSSVAARTARGRFARNAVVQGPAAELFKAWAATVRAELSPLGGQIVLCLHDELLLHVPRDSAQPAVDLLHRTLAATAGYWAAGSGVRLVAEVSVLHRWSDAPH